MHEAAANLKVLTYNVKLFPALLTVGPPEERRCERIARAVSEGGYDVVCFQELFNEGLRARMEALLAPRFPHRFAKCVGKGLLDQDSGLFFASRFPIVRRHFEEFEDRAGVFGDARVDKGVFVARLDLGALRPDAAVDVFNTHLQSEVEGAPVRVGQLAQLARFVAQFRDHGAPPPALLLGDLNVVAEEERADGAVGAATAEYGALRAALGAPLDVFRALRPADPGFTWDAPQNRNLIPPDDGDRQLLDYALLLPDRAGRAAPNLVPRSAAVRPFGDGPHDRLSDHFGVEAAFSFA
jgi:endonuclease/exonuclease/phosphatase family metal-dependent hydrolase